MPILSSPSRPVHSRVVFDSASRLPRRSFGHLLSFDHTPADWAAVDASLATDDESMGVSPDDAHTADHLNGLWNRGHVDASEGRESAVDPTWDAHETLCYERGVENGTRGRRAVRHTSIDEAFDEGRDAAKSDAAPVPPAQYPDGLKGAWLDGYGEGEMDVIARYNDHLDELRDHAEALDGYAQLVGAY